ncbi:MAG TPA: glycosyltransferase [Thermoanaerobaculia bacterium]|nr:glycosyltransferase [Thermoanaerobaculia bacterium]
MFNRARADVRRFVRQLLPEPVRRGYHRFALRRDFGIDPRTGRRHPAPLERTLPRGINFFGWFDSPTGIGQSLRGLARAAESAGVPVSRIDVKSFDAGFRPSAPFALNVFHVNADAAASIVELAGPSVHRGHANVGYWYWETEEFPRMWRDRFAYFDEIWVASEFCRASIARQAEIPVVVVAPPVILETTPPPAVVLGNRGRFRFLTICDADSVPERKNPLGAVRAFARAFSGNPSVSLTVRIANAAGAPGLVAALRNAAGAAHVEIDTAPLERGGIERLLEECDGYVSLHRAEGFGLPIAEAMALGKPVVATAYSGPSDFLDEATGFPVRWEPAVQERALPPYPSGTRWAEPDEEHAAEALDRVLSDPAEAARRGAAGRRRMESSYGLAIAGRRVAERLDRLLARLAARP